MGLFKSKMAKEGDKQKGSKEHGEGNTTPLDPSGKGGNHGNKGKLLKQNYMLSLSVCSWSHICFEKKTQTGVMKTNIS